MFGLFKRKTEREKLLGEAYRLSKTDRTWSGAKTAEAEEVRKELDA